jgi:fructose-1,6-bisphosphatase/inositol monophosphatase family enzyme
MGDVEFGFVHDFGTEEEWTATRGEGARLNGHPLDGELPKERIEILSFEATRTASVAEKAAAVVDLAYRLRIMGSLALSLCHLAAGRVDAVCSLKPARAVDIAAAQLLVRERGLAIELFEIRPSKRRARRPGAFTGGRSGNARAVPAARRRALRIGWNTLWLKRRPSS